MSRSQRAVDELFARPGGATIMRRVLTRSRRRVEVRGIEPRASTVRLLRSTN